MIIKTHIEFNNILFNNNSITNIEYSFLNFLFQIYFENKCKNNFYQVDDYIAAAIKLNKRTILNVRKSLIKKGYIIINKSVINHKLLVCYNINFDKLIADNNNNQSLELSNNPSSQLNVSSAAPQPPAEPEQSTCNNNQILITSATLKMKQRDNINSKGQNKPNKSISLKSNINIPFEKRVSKIEEKGHLNANNKNSPELIQSYRLTASKDKENILKIISNSELIKYKLYSLQLINTSYIPCNLKI